MAAQPRDRDHGALEEKLGHRFRNRALLRRALTHPSREDDDNYQRLEFFGDRVIGLLVAELLFETFPEAGEGELSHRLNAHVRREALAEVAHGLGLGPHIRMAPATEETGGRDNPAILSDVVEAVLAALYLDGGLEAARRAVRELWRGRLSEAGPEKDAKTRLQEWLQARGRPAPHYRVTGRSGPDHAPEFRVRVRAGKKISAEGSGASRQAAEFAAAAALLDKLEEAEKAE